MFIFLSIMWMPSPAPLGGFCGFGGCLGIQRCKDTKNNGLGGRGRFVVFKTMAFNDVKFTKIKTGKTLSIQMNTSKLKSILPEHIILFHKNMLHLLR